MSAVMLDAPSRAVAEGSSPAPQREGRMTLEARLQGVWRLLRAEGAAACPACGGEMTLRAGIGECGDCGARMR